jgi:hypothetical protein
MEHKLFELIDDVKHKLTDEEYLAIANVCKELFQANSSTTSESSESAMITILASTLSVTRSVIAMRDVGIPKVELVGVSEDVSQKYDQHHTLVTNALDNLYSSLGVFATTLKDFVVYKLSVNERD